MTALSCPAPGIIPMPEHFKYKEVYLKGRPRHDRLDRFTAQHPPMPVDRWAKIFSPFDALRGFTDAIKAQEASTGEEPQAQQTYIADRITDPLIRAE